jgi:hypothetical protein
MATYLLTWNPDRWEWSDLDNDVRAVRRGRRPWRLGASPPSLVGTTVSESTVTRMAISIRELESVQLLLAVAFGACNSREAVAAEVDGVQLDVPPHVMDARGVACRLHLPKDQLRAVASLPGRLHPVQRDPDRDPA